jgi:hypothetical protein
MSQPNRFGSSRGLTWRQPVVCGVATIVCTFLAIWAVLAAPVGLVPGVSGLYLAAAIYVPLALWFGAWGSIAGYLSCLFMGFYLGLPLPFLIVWSLADFFEGFVPLLIYRKLKITPAKPKHPKVTYALLALLALDVAVAGAAIILASTQALIASFVASIALLIIQAALEDHKTGITWLAVGVFVASITSAVFGVGALLAFGNISVEIFPTVFFGWVFGDIIVLSTIGTILTITLTPHIMKTRTYVQNFFS